MRLTRRQAIIVAVICGVLAALLSYAYLRRVGTARQPVAPTTATVVLAQVDVPVGTRLSPAMLGTKSIPVDQVPTDAVLSIQEASGWVAVAPIAPGELITRSNAREPSSTLGLSFLVPEGMRAVTVALDQVSGLSGLGKPGDHVDVIVTFDLPTTNTTLTRTVLQDVEVLAMGTQVTPGEEKPRVAGEGEGAPPPPKVEPTATLAVTPQDAERLVLADSEGKIRLSLRRAGDKSYVQLPSVINWNLIGYRPPEEKPAPPPQAAPQPQVMPPWYQGPFQPPPPQQPAQPGGGGVEVIRGGQREVIVP